MLRAGSLNRRVRIEREVPLFDEAGDPVRDAAGEAMMGWELVAKLWADVRFDSGLSAIRNESPTEIARASIRIRYRTGIEHGMRAVQEGGSSAIVYVDQAGIPYADEAGKVYVARPAIGLFVTIFAIRAVLPDASHRQHVDLVCEVVNGQL